MVTQSIKQLKQFLDKLFLMACFCLNGEKEKLLPFITHEKSFDVGLKVRDVFLDISKAFDKVWQERPIFKLKQNHISADLLHN